MNALRFIRFKDVYREALAKAVLEHPGDYSWRPGATVDSVADRMCASVEQSMAEGEQNMHYNHEGRAFRTTCKVLGIKHTRKAIRAFLNGEGA